MKPTLALRSFLLGSIFLTASPVLKATIYYWDTGSSTWATGANWSDNTTSGGTTGVVPSSTDSVVFNQSSVNGAETITIAAATSIAGLTFNNTGTTGIRTDGAANRAFTIGAGGITIASGAGAVTFGTTTNLQRITFTLGADQTWLNNSTTNPFALNSNNTITNGGFTLTFDGAGSFSTGTGAISGGGGIIKKGVGTLTLAAANNYSGDLTIKAGTVNVNNSSAAGVGGTVKIDTGGAVNATVQTSTSGVTLLNPITVVAGSTGTNTLGTSSNSTSYSGLITANENLSINNFATSAVTLTVFGGGASVANGKTITLQNNNASGTSGLIVANGIVTGNGGLATSGTGTGTITITGASTYTGGFTLGGSGTAVIATSSTGTDGSPTDGAFGAGSTASILGTGNIRAAAGVGGDMTIKNTLTLAGNITVGTVASENSLIFTGPATLTGTRTFTANVGATVAGKSLTFSGVIGESGGAQGITKAGTGTMVLSNVANTFTGVTTISGGILNVAKLDNINTVSSIGKGSLAGSAADLVINGGVLQYTGTTAASTDRLFTIGTSGATLNASGTTAGTLSFTGVGNLAFSSSASPATLTLTGTGTGATGAGILASIIGDSGGATPGLNITSVTKSSTGTWTLSGANTYTGATTIGSGGTLVVTSIDNVANANPLGKSSAAAANLLIGNTSTLKYTGGAANTDRSFTLNNGLANGNNFTLDASGAGAINWTNTASPAFTNTDYSLSLILTGDNTNNNTLASNLGNNGAGAVSIQKTGTGTWVLSGNISNTGTTIVSAGTLNLTGNRTVAPTGNPGISVGGVGATLNISGDIAMGTSQFRLGSAASQSNTVNQTAGLVSFTGGTQVTVGTVGGDGIYNLSGGELRTAAAAGRGVMIGSSLNANGTFNLSSTGFLNMTNGGNSVLDIVRSDGQLSNGLTATFAQTGGAATIGILRIGGGDPAQQVSNTANLNLSAGTFTAATFTALSGGLTSVSNINISGTADVTLPEFPQTGLGTGSTAIITFDGGTLKNSGTSSNYLGVITSAFIKNGGAKFNTSGGNITISHSLENFSGHTGKLTKEGTNTLTLTGTNTYTGTTTVTAGSLAVNGSLANTTTTIGAGTPNTGKLQGSGSIGGSVTIQNGGTLAPGNSIESLGTGALTLATGSTFAYELNKDAATANESGDLAFITGNLSIDLTNAAVLTLAELGVGAGTWDLNEKLTLLSYTGTWNGGLFTYGDTLTDGEIFSFSGANWQFNYNDTFEGANYTADSAGKYVTMTVVPEPGTALIGSLGILALLRRRRN